MYKGDFVDGKKEDRSAELKWENGKVYKGEFKDGFMDGEGKLYMKGGKG